MIRKIRWLIINALWAGVVYAATVLQLAGAYYVIIFITILSLISAVGILMIEEVAENAKKSETAFGTETETLFDFFIACWLIYFGLWVIATIYFLSNIIIIGIKK